MTKVVKVSCSSCKKLFLTTLLIDGDCNGCRINAQAELEDRQAEDRAVKERSQKAKTRTRRTTFAERNDPGLTREIDVTTEVKKELARRELAKRRYLPFVQRFNPEYLAGWVHIDICQRLEKFVQDVADKKSPRLMIFMPPRHGKSQLTSKTLAAWVLGHYPTWEFIQCSYSGSLANKFSRNVRGILRDPLYEGIFNTRLNKDTQGQEMWETTEGGGLLAAGVGGPITGNGAHILCIDDPVKNREEAESATQREGTWDWYTSTAYTRLAPGGGILVIQTRWHDDDLSGRLLKKQKDGEGDTWDVVEYPAVAERDERFRKKGEALHPERYDEKALARIRKVSERDWWALYQQKPIADEGAYFTRDMFDFYLEDDRPPDDEMVFYDAWDLAVATKEHNDFSVGIKAGFDRDEHLWFTDLLRLNVDTMELVEHIIDLHQKRKSQITGIERGQIDQAIGPFLDKRIRERKAWGLFVEPLKPGKRDKVLRARPIQGMARQGYVHLPHPSWCPWVNDFVNELLRFPAGAFDDQVDAFAWIGQMITDMAPSVPAPKPKKKSWKDRLDEFVTSDDNAKSFMSA